MNGPFTVIKEDKNSLARTGEIKTPHGVIETPAYAIVGTHAEVKTLSPGEVRSAGTKLIIANTYHLWKDLGEKLSSFEGVHKRMNLPDTPIMTDSGGFQVFSYGFRRESGMGKIISEEKKKNMSGSEKRNLVRITEEGVYFKEDENDKEKFLGPELSISIQEKLGADIIFAFDECTSPLETKEYTKEAMERTHRWAKICLEVKKNKDQMLYGIVQGGVFPDLRKESAEYIASLPFDGFGIGGSFGERQMGESVRLVNEILPKEKPRHLLGIGTIRDIFVGVENGIDTFDCVIPTREARHGAIWTHEGRIDLKKSKYKNKKKLLEKKCGCPACASGTTRGELHELFKAKDPHAGRLATIHNVFFFNKLMEEIRESIKKGKFRKLKRKMLE